MTTRFLFAFALLTSIDGLSCSCFFSFDKDHLDKITTSADLIFSGTVTQVIFNWDSTVMETRFLVNERFKGDIGIVVISRQGLDSTCSAYYKVGKTYLVLGYLIPIYMVTSDSCSSWTSDIDAGIRPLEKAYFERLRAEFKKRKQ